MSVTFDGRALPDGTVLLMGVTYPRSPTEYTYALMKAAGLWYVTGSGRVPIAAGWGAVERWLAKDDREVRWVRAATAWDQLWPAPPEPTGEIDNLTGIAVK